ncbi:cytochrome p450 protein [Rutstroemia sp. NJR-2017a BVV2]|nr:cytochrome p450 protein [Rutstroemia sp. NJR-2017a BVV2]PQE18372.1 cytochrome p450 protein [Rutstroemia sp. NJR-2017a BVV2]
MAGLPTNIPTVYTFRTDYFSNNLTLENEMWDNLNLDASVVALDPEYVAQHKLEKSSPFPWDTEREKYMRKAFMDLQAGDESVIPPDHVYHCIGSLRQDIMCKADDTPMPSPRILNSVGDQQVLQCRDFSKVVEWAMSPERNACYRAGNDFRPVIHNLDRHAYCHVDSPWYHVANEYFAKHGHRNPWGDDD